MQSDLFSPVTIGSLELRNRLVMAPLTRVRSGADGVPGPLVAEHYRQRASLGLIITEGIYPSAEGQGFSGQPGLVTQAQLQGWRKVTDEVHAEGGKIFAQVMHAGRATHPEINGGYETVAPSAVAVEGVIRTPLGKLPCAVPRALAESELDSVRDIFVRASLAAVEAGFDGVELHGANGYLLHEFLSPASNQRTDSYGGSPAARARFVVEVFTAVAAAIGAERVGLRISPEHNIQDVRETCRDDVQATYSALVDGIAPFKPAYLSILHAEPAGDLVQELGTRFGGPVLLNSGFSVVTTREEATEMIARGLCDAVVVGRPALANPDLVRRWREELPLNEPDAATFYADGPEGYTDYPVYTEALPHGAS